MSHTLENIIFKISDATGKSISDINGKRRFRTLVVVRHLFCYYAKKLTNHSLREVGIYVRGSNARLDHTTVISAIKKTIELRDTHDELLDTYVRMVYDKYPELDDSLVNGSRLISQTKHDSLTLNSVARLKELYTKEELKQLLEL